MKMGCNKEKIKKLLLSSFVTILIFLAIATPVVIGENSTINVTFDPQGSVTLDVTPATLNFSTVDANGNEESSSAFTLYNNGTISMNTTADTNSTTDTKELTLDEDGSPIEDYFSLQFTDCASFEGDDAYITDAGMTLNKTLTPATQSGTFKVTIHLGDISANHSWQATTINFTGAPSTD
jgi:hypothetical protein